MLQYILSNIKLQEIKHILIFKKIVLHLQAKIIDVHNNY